MIPEIGHFALILCLALSIVQGVPCRWRCHGNRALMAVARPAAAANAFFGTVGRLAALPLVLTHLTSPSQSANNPTRFALLLAAL